MRITLYAFATFAGIVSMAQPSRLLLASNVFPPFTNVETETRVASQLVNEALKRDGVRVSTEIVEFSEVLQGIKNSKYHGSAAIWTSDERQDKMLFSEPYMQNRLVIVGRKGADVSMSSLEDLQGSKLGLVQDYAYGEELDEVEGIERVVSVNDQQNLRRLLAEEIDYMLLDELLVQYLMIYQKREIGQYLEVGTAYLITHPLHLAIRKDIDGAELLIENFNRRIHEMAVDGTYNKILHVSWLKVDADGDGTLEYVLQGTQAGRSAPAGGYSLFNASGGASNDDQYMIDGKVYKGWQSVPGEYKVAPTSDESLNKLRILDFGLPTPRN